MFIPCISTIADCLPSIAGGLIWDGQSANRTSVRRCSDLHSVFNSGLTVSRRCNEFGIWEDVDFSGCTMKPSMNREVIVDQTELPNNNQMDINSYESMVNLTTSVCLVRVHNTKNQLLHIDPPTIVGCSL